MVIDSSVDASMAELLDALPDGVVWANAASNTAGGAVAFRVAYVNTYLKNWLFKTNVTPQVDTFIGCDLRATNWLPITESVDSLALVFLEKKPQTALFFDEQTAAWVQVRASRMGTGILLCIRNVSTEKVDRERFNRSSRDLQSVIDFAQTGIFLFTPVYDEAGHHVDFRFTAINRMVANLVGQAPDVLVGAVASDWFISYRETGLFNRYKHTFETGELQRFEINYNVDGFDVWFDVQCLKLDGAVLVTFTDFTLLKQAQQAIEDQAIENQKQANLLNSVLDSSDSGVIAFEAIRDPAQANSIVDFRFVVANKACVGLLGKPLDEMVGHTLLTIFPGNAEVGLFDLYKHTAETGEPGRTEVYYNHDGLDFWLAISAHQLGDGFVVTFTDISDLKRLQQQLEGLITDLRHSNANLEQFAYVASHDLQEPLRKIQAFGDVLMNTYGLGLGQQGSDLINRMQKAAGRMSMLIRDLLAYSRLATQRQEPTAVDLSKVFGRVLDDLDMPMQESGAVVQIGSMPTVPGNETQLQQLLQNLLTNAIKFRRVNTAPLIQVRSRRVLAAQLPANVCPARRTSAYYCLTVQDNGIGFDAKYADRIFQVFQRLHGRGQYDGTGIGLAVVQKVAENHGGVVVASSHPGEGATFEVYLPE